MTSSSVLSEKSVIILKQVIKTYGKFSFSSLSKISFAVVAPAYQICFRLNVVVIFKGSFKNKTLNFPSLL